MTVESAIPILPVLDLGESEAFYARLGFETANRYGGYAILKRGAVEVHLVLSPKMDPKTTVGEMYLRVGDAQSLYESLRAGLQADGLLVLNRAGALTREVAAELARRDAAGEKSIRVHELHDTDYGVREFGVVDPSGNVVKVGQRLSG